MEISEDHLELCVGDELESEQKYLRKLFCSALTTNAIESWCLYDNTVFPPSSVDFTGYVPESCSAADFLSYRDLAQFHTFHLFHMAEILTALHKQTSNRDVQ